MIELTESKQESSTGKSQFDEQSRKTLEKQQYRIIGNHSAVKVCGWTKTMIRGKGSCYKHKFYGIQSHRCLQMTTSISCANRCTFCWRDYKAPVSKEWKWDIDEPDFIIDEAIKAQQDLLVGFYGNEAAKKILLDQANEPRHVALSLTGEPITYPKFNELCREFHKRNISTFIVTNAQYPDAIRTLKNCTQLYISIDAPNKQLLKSIDKPLFPDYWERLNQSLEYLSEKDFRTAVRLTIVKGQNDSDLEGYRGLILKGDPDFIEVKGYMYVGASRERLEKENMPDMDDVRQFTEQLAQLLPDYELAGEQKESWVVLLAKKTFNKKTWIDYPKFFEDAKIKDYE